MIAGLEYALTLHFFKGNLAEGKNYVERAITSFEHIGNEYQLNMALVMKGDIELKSNNLEKAKDTYRTVMQRADRNAETLQYVRSCLGLAETYLVDHHWRDAIQSIDHVRNIDLRNFRAERDRLAAINAQLPQRSDVTLVDD